ncbi:LysR family transcriptional regulator [Brevibacillus ginsengisoli]|uniref:LysR family transcriptional regulator n=1 Tax=Brevibacillus ginsengisoli TaxID=363854 RepID=UPI003CED5273
MDQQLSVFVSVVEKQNFSRAAEDLHMTQPAVSHYIQQLERTLGTRLLERSNKFVRLTKAGEVVYHHAKEILTLYSRMQYLVDDMTHAATGVISIGASYTYGEYVLPHIIARLRDRYPLIQPTIRIGNSTEIAELIANHQIDIGVVEGDLPSQKMMMEPIADDVMVVIASANHRLAGQTEVHVSELAGETWIVRERGSGTREATEGMFAKLQISVEHVMEFGSTQIIKESVEAGLGITLVSNWAIQKELKLGTIQVLPLKGTPIIRKFSLLTQATNFQTKAMEIFAGLIREEKSF